MSVLINIEMPKNCKECKIACEPYLSLYGLMAKLLAVNSVRSDCPLSEFSMLCKKKQRK